jgi:antitoxin VapB
MALNIKNDDAEDAIRRLAEQTGDSLTGAVHQAVLDKLAGLDRAAARAARMERVTRISDELARGLGPYAAGMTTDDLYDPDTGLPA